MVADRLVRKPDAFVLASLIPYLFPIPQKTSIKQDIRPQGYLTPDENTAMIEPWQPYTIATPFSYSGSFESVLSVPLPAAETASLDEIVFRGLTPQSDLLDNQSAAVLGSALVEMLRQNALIDQQQYDHLNKQHCRVDDTGSSVFASNPVYVVDMKTGRGTKSLVMKFDDNFSEFDVTRYLSASDGVSVANPLGTLTDIDIAGKKHSVYVSEFVPGKSLGELLKQKSPNFRDDTFRYIQDAVTQLSRIQVRGLRGEQEGRYRLRDVAQENRHYFTDRVRDVFQGQTTRFLEGVLSKDKIRRFNELAEIVIGSYSEINDALIAASERDAVFYSDHSPNNIICRDDGSTTSVDLASGRKMLGIMDFISLTEFGKLNASETSYIDYLSGSEKDELFDQYLLERKLESAQDPGKRAQIRQYIDSHRGSFQNGNNRAQFESYISAEEREEALKLRALASIQRHLEYIGYAQRDIHNAQGEIEELSLPNKRNELNRQIYHLNMVRESLTELNRLDPKAIQDSALRNTLWEISYILQDQKIEAFQPDLYQDMRRFRPFAEMQYRNAA